jgi:hypothetical protein
VAGRPLISAGYRIHRRALRVDEDANPPLTDPTKTDVDRDTKTVPPQGADTTKSDVHSEQGSKPPQDARLMARQAPETPFAPSSCLGWRADGLWLR